MNGALMLTELRSGRFAVSGVELNFLMTLNR